MRKYLIRYSLYILGEWASKFETEESRTVIESELILVATVGLTDDLREGIFDSVLALHLVKTNTRILSGDHRETVVKIA